MKEFIEKLIERLEEYKYSHLVEHDKERLEHCTENERAEHCEGIDCFWCVWDKSIEIVNQLAEEYNNGWIPVDMEVPPNDNYVLVSFDNFSLPDIARYEEDNEGGAFYPGDEEKSYASFGLFVNAWMPLPEPYRP